MIPMAISLGFGILFATTVTLIIVPCLYMITEDVRKVFGLLHSTAAELTAVTGSEPG
jgi:hypothetical protein